MQYTTLSGSDATGRAGDGGDLFGREFVLFIKTGCNFTSLESCSISNFCPVVGQIVAALFDCFVFGHKRIMGYIPTNLSNPSDL